MKRPLDPFEFEGLRFRLLEREDLPTTLAWRNKERIRTMFFHSEPLTMAGHRAWFEAYSHRDDDFVFIVEAPPPLGRPIGQAALYKVEWEAGRAEFGRLMVGEDEALGRGYGRKIVQCIARYALGSLGLLELYAWVKAGNEPSIRSFLAAGYTLENPGEDPVLLVRRGFGPPEHSRPR